MQMSWPGHPEMFWIYPKCLKLSLHEHFECHVSNKEQRGAVYKTEKRLGVETKRAEGHTYTK